MVIKCFLEFSLCLSRACLGKIITFIYKWRKNAAAQRDNATCYNCYKPVDGEYNRNATVWLPPGEWHDAFSGARFQPSTNQNILFPYDCPEPVLANDRIFIVITNSTCGS
jgi:hypothetical protein